MRVEDKKNIYKSFMSGFLETLSVSEDKKVEWKVVSDVTRHDVEHKDQYEISTITGKKCEVTGDHSLFIDGGKTIRALKTAEFKVGDPLVTVLDEVCGFEGVSCLKKIPKQKYMYDLSVEDNHNFVLENGILAHNTFRPPAHEKFIQAHTQVFGYIWEDEELYEYLLMSVDLFNSAPPVTGVTLDDIPPRWRTIVLMRAAAMACAAAALTWIVNEFDYSISGVSLSIEKSSKYESMKNNFLTEYKEAQELAKRSIKIVRGLRQPRYGIGISSALGPYSRPGVQSRRNYISGFRGGWT